MPALPLYSQRTSLNGGAQGYINAPREMQAVAASNAEAEGLARVGAGLQDVARGQFQEQLTAQDILKKQEEETARSWVGTAVPDLTIKAHSLFEEMKAKAQGPANGFVPQYLEKFDDMAKASIEMAPDKLSKRYLASQLQSVRTSMGNSAVGFEAGATRAYRVEQSDQASDSWATIVARDPRQFETAFNTIKETAPDVGPEMRTKLEDNARKKLITAAAGTSVTTDPGGTYSAINQALNIKTPVTANPFKVAAAVDGLPTSVQKLIGAFFAQESSSGAADTSQPNYAGALGPMQVTQGTFEGIKKKGLIPATADWRNPDDSTAAGVAHIKDLYEKFKGDPRLVAAAYYAGEKAVSADGTITDYKDLKNPKAPTTLEYVAQVVKRLGGVSVGMPALAPLQPVDVNTGELPAKTGVPWIDNATPQELLHYRAQAYTEMQRTNSVAKNGLERTERDLQATALSGAAPTNVPPKEQYVAAFGGIEGPIRYKENVTDVVALGESIRALSTASPEERAALINSAKPATQEGAAAAAQKLGQLAQANAIIEQQLKTDPAIYVSKNSPRVKAAFQELAALPPTAPPEAQRAAVDKYAAESLSEQKRLGAKVPQLLTDDQASKIAASFTNQKEGGDNSAKLMEGLQRQWGPYFPTVFQQLQKDDKLPMDAMVIPNMKDAGSKERLARLAVVPDKDLKERLNPGDEKDLKAALMSTMQPFWNTISMQGGGERTFAAAQRSAERLAMSYMASGKSASKAAEQAYEEIVGHGYQFENTYRIPKGEMPEQITEGVRSVMRHLQDLPLVVPPSQPGLKPEEAQKQYLDSIRAGATFVTNRDESGVLLYVNGKNGMVPVRGPNGQITLTWKQLRDEYQTTVGKPYFGTAKP